VNSHPTAPAKDRMMEQYTQSDLEAANGQDGAPTLIAFDGKVYDVSSSRMWRKGVHFKSHHAGQDLTAFLSAAPHGDEVFKRFEQVGVLVEEKALAAQIRTPPRWIERILNEHPHPISVHFPIALSLVGSFFMVLFVASRWLAWPWLQTEGPFFERFALYCIVLATLAAPVSILTGLWSWYYNYNAVWTRIYRFKTGLSVVLMVLQILALTLRVGLAPAPDLASGAYVFYAVLMVAMAPTVMALGYFGGQITFPR